MIPLFYPLAFSLKNYHGGSNPLLVVIFIGLVIFLALCGIGYMFLTLYRAYSFNRICVKSKMSGEEIGILRSFIRRLHVREPLELVKHKGRFDDFSNRVAHYYEGTTLSEEDLLKEAAIMLEIRTKLAFPNKFRRKGIYTSRALPVGFPLHVICQDPDSGTLYTFRSEVIYNHELFLGIKPPPQEMDSEIDKRLKPSVEISMRWDKDREYFFNSHVVRSVNYPQTMWYIAHSQEVIEGPANQPIDLPAIVMLANPDHNGNVEEFAVNIHNLSHKGCAFEPNVGRHPFDFGPKVLISFEIEPDSYTCRGEVTNIIQRGSTRLYHLDFARLSTEQEQSLLRYVLKKQQETKSKHSRRKATAQVDS